ncbi:DNA primase [Anaplasma phagocytophilum str. CR1007]|nr:DNA primase [Anaplasma phagocytophilum str. JM]AGR81351.1 DNA primase [Anaplasma phagocytophilum str. Dog2]KJV60429.1 DNA primase [Anaplasma phagocytophilum str. Webster]KJV83441.1 DNA primase [Anaplasma phagocytophilum str. HGE2]KJV87809.1 DNA primase [Anaplasma phagocytophilum str. ApNYW]KJV98974.1 DNA primase [Anaplasma phagocytophilum str. Annie]KJZ99417.1 DNA primase [Anaplasma phagocytophilum str. CR1007]
MMLGSIMQNNNSITDNITLLRSKIRLIDVVAGKIKLTKRSGNNYVGLCPFHSEKTPSFNINSENELFYCFGCGATGDVIQFVSDTEGLDFKQAMQYLSERYHVELLDDKRPDSSHSALYDVMEKAAVFLSQQLSVSKAALSYLKDRGISDSTINRFRLGYVTSTGIKAHLLSLGISMEKMSETGLLTKSVQDCLYNRIIFPICNPMGKVIALGGRSITPGHTPKYLNSAENALFKKRECMYGLHLAMGQAKKLGKIIVVEGYMDVLMLSQLGIHNVVGLLGTSMTEFHLKNIWSVVPEIIVWLDGDFAGLKASVKIAQLAVSIMKSGSSIRFISIAEGKDPYDICREQSIDFVKDLIERAKLLSEFIWEYELSSSGIGDKVVPEQCMMLEGKIKEYTSRIQDPNVAKHYRNFFYQQMKALQGYKKWNANSYAGTAVSRANKVKSCDRLQDVSMKVCMEENYQLRVMYTIIECPKLLDDPAIFEQFASIDFSSVDRRVLQQHIVDIKSTCDNVFLKQDLVEKLRPRGQNLEAILQYIIRSMANVGCAFIVPGLSDESIEKLAKQEWEKLMLSRQLNEIHEQIVKLRLEGKNDVALNLSEYAREIDDKLRSLWKC